MKIGSRQQFAHPVFYPLVALHTTTTRAVPVTAVMILVVQMPAPFIAAPVMMHTYGCCMATTQTAQYCPAVRVKTTNQGMSKDFCLKQLPSLI